MNELQVPRCKFQEILRCLLLICFALTVSTSYSQCEGEANDFIGGGPAFSDYDKALECAQERRKPLIVFFTGYADVNSRQMKEKVFMNTNIQKRLLNEFLVCVLMVDDRTLLPEEEMERSTRTLGQKNLKLEKDKYGLSFQPAFVAVDTAGRAMNSIGHSNLWDFGYFMDKAKKNFKEAAAPLQGEIDGKKAATSPIPRSETDWPPVEWSGKVEFKDEKRALVKVEAAIPEGWVMYGEQVNPFGPPGVNVSITDGKWYNTLGPLSSPDAMKAMDPIYKMDANHYTGTVVFQQEILVNTKKEFLVYVDISYMMASEFDIIPPEGVMLDLKVPARD